MNEKWEQQVRKMCALCCSTVFDSRHRRKKRRNVLSHTHTPKRNDSFLCCKKSRDNSQKKALVSLFRHAVQVAPLRNQDVKIFRALQLHSTTPSFSFFFWCAEEMRRKRKRAKKSAASIRTEDRNMARSHVRYCLILLLWRTHTRNSTFAETILHRNVGMESAWIYSVGCVRRRQQLSERS